MRRQDTPPTARSLTDFSTARSWNEKRGGNPPAPSESRPARAQLLTTDSVSPASWGAARYSRAVANAQTIELTIDLDLGSRPATSPPASASRPSKRSRPGSGSGSRSSEVSALLVRPPDAHCLYLLAHGAGAGMRHDFLEEMSARLAGRGVATLRYQFPYTEAGRKRPDRPAELERTVRAAAAEAARRAPDLPLIAGGKSMGGRMTSQAQAAGPLPGVRGLVFLGFPLHPAGQPSTARAEHLARVAVPMLFLQGTRDDLADLELLVPILRPLGTATLADR